MSAILDLVQARGVTLRQVAGTHGGEWAGPCPVCGGRDRFRVWPAQDEGTWWCRKCENGGDAIEFLRHVEGLGYKEACERLGVAVREAARRPLAAPRPPARPVFGGRDVSPSEGLADPGTWLAKAEALVSNAHARLLADPGQLAYLAGRGLDEAAVRRFRLGWLQGEKDRGCFWRDRAAWGLAPREREDGKPKRLWIPRGIVIPNAGPDGALRGVRIRRPPEDRERFAPDTKYYVLPGSAAHTLVLGPEARAFVIVEAELDAMAVQVAAENLAGAVSVLSAKTRPDRAAHELLGRALAILVALDFDQDGAAGWAWWRDNYPRAVRWPVPVGKDPGDAAASVDLRSWVQAGLPPALTLGPSLSGLGSSGAGGISCAAGGEEKGVGAAAAAEPAPAVLRPAPARTSPARPTRPACRADGLCLPRDGRQAVAVLRDCGLEPVPDGLGDFELRGHERWPVADVARLFAWLRRHGELVREAVCGHAQERQG